MGKSSKRPAYVRCGDKKYLMRVIGKTIVEMFRHWREIPQIIRDGVND